MKKYISILSLSIALVIVSCRGENDDIETATPKEQVELQKKLPSSKESVTSNKTLVDETDGVDNLDTGDDEPRPDKQHWKIKNDTVQ